MFRWYRDAERRYVYLSDVSRSTSDGDDDASQRWKPAFRKSRWFTRGWTLQELHGFLWIKGKPGTGKSTLMKYAFANARKKMKDLVVISFFFNARGESIEKSTIGTYMSLLLQLLEQLPNLQSIFESPSFSTLGAGTEHQWSIESLKALLEYAIQGLGESSVICFIDALDECKEDQIRDIVSFFKRIGELATSRGIRLQVCFSSRHYPHITLRKGLDLVLEGQEGHTQDITNYLKSKLKIRKSKVAQQKASGDLMWVVLVIDILNKEHDHGRMHALKRRLKDTPRYLHKLFRDILTRDSHNRDELVLCIQWVLFAKQPLSPEQLYFAILAGIELDAVSKWDPKEITRDVIKRFILSSSKGLAEITTAKLQKVQFIHESVRDFLLKEDGLSNIWTNLGTNLQGQSHERLKHCCLNYMSVGISTSLKIPEILPKASSLQAADLRNSATDAFPFLEYAVHHVLYHANMAEGSSISQAQFLESFQLPQWIRLNNLFEKREVRRHSAGVSLLYLLGENNMPNLIGVHSSVASCLEVENECYGPPIFAAMATGSKEAVETFLKNLVVNQPAGPQLYEVSAEDYYEECSQTRIGRDFKDKYEQTLLSRAASNGSEAVVKLLLETGKVDVDSKDNSGRTPLSRAAWNGSEAVVKLLLETGKVDVDSKNNYGWTPLLRAAWNGRETIVKLLLEAGKVDVNSKDKDGQTALSSAAWNGSEAVVKLLRSYASPSE
ncbi:hypothetical protein K458DRAFT_456076 [Lentithecium fluviatile CBS 122367]|uniref:Nephrocystin 3-like N-terminal domain-containing protein n=1 Tax=Lentithecium fluviatile CBS 122367 TaxID=1168545 RepID=A0A6G1IWB1_9PLEO|nr:hypothetical protein K458DRAFT_456076 [Lentithecium fluviatile CBS 122367]